jgi:putative nucleotidyltransferase with HDIG domain
MKNNSPIHKTLIKEELKAIKLFLFLFYTVFLYGIFEKLILQRLDYQEKIEIPEGGLGVYYYIILLLLLPFTVYLINKGKTVYVKYMYFIAYTVLNLIEEILIYNTSSDYKTGDVGEILFILFSPIFVNSRFFWLVTIGTTLKYILKYFVTNQLEITLVITLIVFLTIVTYLILSRFKGYLKAIKDSYDAQMEGIVKGVVATLELKDPYTRGHSDRVANYSLLLAKSLGEFSEEELKYFYYACLLHDVGKINIPDKILMKPGRLTDEEFAIIKSHPVVGAEILKGIEGIVDCIDVIKYHHERWDGKGYPEQLSGGNIPLLARITAVADAFDAMTSTRSYRSALSNGEAFNRIVEGKGTQFDPDLVDAFVHVYPDWVKFSESTYKITEKDYLTQKTI